MAAAELKSSNLLEFEVPQPLAGMRADAAAASLATGISRSRIQKSIENGSFYLNGKICAEKRSKVAAGDRISFVPPEEEIISDAEPENIPLNILYQDDDILVIDKPAGMTVHPAAGNLTGTVVNAVLGLGAVSAEDFEHEDGEPLVRPGIAHRLDKDTSGCLVIARNENSLSRLSMAFAAREVRKTYLALVSPAPQSISGKFESYIGRSRSDRKKMAVYNDSAYGKLALTSYRVLKSGMFGKISFALLEVKIATGRTHQIRVHLSHAGMPVIGDALYGGSRRFGAARQLLHAWKIELHHPVSGKPMQFVSEIPQDFTDILNRMENTK